MLKKRYTPEEIIQHLRTVELDIGHGLAVLDSCRTLGITEQTDDRGKKESGGLRVGSRDAAEGAGAGESVPHADGRVIGIGRHLALPVRHRGTIAVIVKRVGLGIEQARRCTTSLTSYENLSGNCFTNALVSVSAMR